MIILGFNLMMVLFKQLSINRKPNTEEKTTVNYISFQVIIVEK